LDEAEVGSAGEQPVRNSPIGGKEKESVFGLLQ